jgi:O-antigen/teichoic acid export membrane protein
MQQSQKNNFKSIIKSSAIFGGTQVFTILTSLVRGKVIAVYLGPAGMGIAALLTNTTSMIQQFSSCGVNMTAVKDVSQAEVDEDKKKIETTLGNIRLLVIFLGIVGLLISLIFAENFSIFTFGNSKYIFEFRLLSIFVFFTTIANGEMSILQGKKKFKKIAIGSVFGAVCGLLIGVPFYYFWGLDGIVPAMLALSFCTLGVNIYLNRGSFNFYLFFQQFSLLEFSVASKRMISLGMVLMIALLLGTLSTYLLNIFITKNGGVGDVGYFQAANSMTNQYIGLVFTAMSIDYFPRLSAICNNKLKTNELVNNQLEIVLLLVAPILTGFMIFSAVAVKILLTSKFLVIVPLLNAMAMGAFFKAASYPLGYISFSKGDKKTFFWMEGVFANLLQLSLNVLFYYYYGLKGLGYSFIVIYLSYLLIVSIVTNRKYEFSFEFSSLKLMSLLGAGCVSVFLIVTIIDDYFLKYILAICGLITILLFSAFELNKRIDILKMIKLKFKKD